MNILNIDITQNIPDIIKTYTEIFGDEYKEVIEKRINETEFIMYNNVEGVEAYYNFLKQCKEKELTFKFLEQIGEDVRLYIPESYVKDLDEHIKKLMLQYTGLECWEPKQNIWLEEGIFSWVDIEKNTDEINVIIQTLYPEKSKREDMIKFINFLRKNSKEPITEENLDIFCKTDEYKKYEERVRTILSIYDQIEEEYNEYLQKLSPYKEYIDNEKEKNYRLNEECLKQLYEELQENLPADIKNFLDKKYLSDEERETSFLENGYEFSQKLYVEYFSKNDEKKLKDDNISKNEKEKIYYYRNEYFRQMYMYNIDIPEFETEEETYKNIIKRDDIKKLIVPNEVADLISKTKKEIYEKSQIENISNEDLVNLFCNKEFLNIKSVKKICYMATVGDTNGTIFFTIRNYEQGKEDYVLLHEICHAIEVNPEQNGSGFDSYIDQANSYNINYRKYERLNETITDIFAIEARKNNIKKGIYIIEPKEYINEDVQNNNTSSILKNMLSEFMKKYRKDIIKARITGNMENFYNVIGKNNFEELNDIINYTDFLIQEKGLNYYLRNNDSQNETVIEYNNQLKRLEQVYKNMDKVNSLKDTDSLLLQNAIQATRKRVRMGQISKTFSDIKNRLNRKNEKNIEK